MLKNGTVWEDCVLVSKQGEDHNYFNNFSKKCAKQLQLYYDTLIKYYGRELAGKEYLDNNIWLDTKSNTVFCRGQYKLPKAFGKDHHFYVRKNNFNKDTKNHFYNRLIRPDANLSKLTYTQIGDDLIYGKNNITDFDMYKGKSVKIVGGGPTTKEMKWENIITDYTWTCNQFYNYEKVTNQKLDLISISSDTPKQGYDHIRHHCQKNNTKACFLLDWGDFNINSPKYLYNLANQYSDNVFYYHTRYASAIGVGVRMIISAILWGAKNIYFVGIDGWNVSKETHSFEKNKHLPSWYAKHGNDFQRRHFVVFWEYIMKLREVYDFNLYNLGELSQNNSYKTMSHLLFPLSSNVKEKIQ